MQKISTYLYPNRVFVLLELGSSITEWRIVYQRTIKIYRGLDNIIEFDVKNAQQRRIDLAGMNIICSIYTHTDDEIFTGSLDLSSTKGLATLTIPSANLDYLTPQYLKYTLYLDDGSTNRPLYVDTAFDAVGQIEVLDSSFSKTVPPLIIDSFNAQRATPPLPEIFYSESVEVFRKNSYNNNTQLNLDFRNINLHADITVQVTTDALVRNETVWKDLETFTIQPTTNRVEKTYNEISDYSNNISWLRIKYTRLDSNTGSLDRIFVRV